MGGFSLFPWFRKKKLARKIEELSPEKKQKLKEFLQTHCIHGVSFDRDIPCLKCMESSNLSDIIPFLK
jgi:hypothetical protein